MNYILYNPKSNNEHNDLNIIPGKADLEKLGVRQICLIGLDVPQFCQLLTADDRVIICGGDGTLHHFANDAYGVEFPCPIFVIRSGTGNDFLNDIGQTDNEHLVDIREYLKDLPTVEVNGKKLRYINGVGFGLDGAVCEEVDKVKARTDKKVNYTTVALKFLAYKYKGRKAKVTVDGVTREYTDVWVASAMKGRYYGGGMMVSPTQDRGTGKISVMVMHGGSRLKVLTIFPSIFKGNHIKHTEIVEIFEGDDVTVEFDIPCALQIDGETESNVLTYRSYSNNVAPTAAHTPFECAEEAEKNEETAPTV